MDVYTFIGRMIQHIPPKGFKRIRYYGVQATKTFEQVRDNSRSLVQGQESSEGGDKDTSAEEVSGEIYRALGKDPFIRPHCGQEMDIWTDMASSVWGDL